MGLTEVSFDLCPGMGSYSYRCRRVSPSQAERMMLEGNVYTSEELHRLGVVDILVPRGEGPAAVEALIQRHRRIPHALRAMHKVRPMVQPATYAELMRSTEVWVANALQLGDRPLRTMERLVRAQLRRNKTGEALSHAL